MIKVKGTQIKDDDADPGSLYAGKEELRPSRRPYLVMALLAAVVLYIQTAFKSTAAEPPPDAPRGSGPGNDAPADDSLTEAAATQEVGQKSSSSAREDGRAGQQATSELALSWDSSVRIAPTISRQRVDAANLNVEPVRLGGDEDLINLPPQRMAVDGSQSQEISDDGGAFAPPPPHNASPKASSTPFRLTLDSGAFTMIAMADLLSSVEDVDGDELAVAEVSVSSGRLVPLGDGFIYLSDPDHVGQVDLQFTVTDGQNFFTQDAKLIVEAKATAGTATADTLTGGAYADILRGNDGADTIDGGAGMDVVYGGSGDDSITGGVGNDLIYGNEGNDLILGGEGNDTLWGGTGDDSITGEAGNDQLMGEAGNDILTDGIGSDTVFGGDGADYVVAAVDAQGDYLDGGAGSDTLDYTSAHFGLVINTVNGRAEGAPIGSDVILGFETIIAGVGNDRMILGFDNMILKGGGGDDIYEFTEEVPTADFTRSVHQILDFSVGDRIRARGLELFSAPDDGESGLLDDPETGAGLIPQITLTYETFNSLEQTVLEWSFDEIDAFVTVTLIGHHSFQWSVAAPA